MRPSRDWRSCTSRDPATAAVRPPRSLTPISPFPPTLRAARGLVPTFPAPVPARAPPPARAPRAALAPLAPAPVERDAVAVVRRLEVVDFDDDDPERLVVDLPPERDRAADDLPPDFLPDLPPDFLVVDFFPADLPADRPPDLRDAMSDSFPERRPRALK